MEDKLEKLKKKSDLSDIILEKDKSSGDKIKKWLLASASLVLLFLIILIAMKMFNTSNISPSENLANAGDNIELAGDRIADSTETTLDDVQDTLFKEEPIIDETSETDSKFEEMVRKLKQQDALQEANDKEGPIETVEKITPPAQESIVEKIKDVIPTPIKKAETKVQEVAKTIIKEVKPEPKEVILSTKKESPAASPISSLSGYFIQVGATAKSFPDRRFLTRVKNSGYDYIVHKVTIKGRDIKKVLIGPYTTRKRARDNLSSVQSKINPSAYIYRIK